jgi:hypothetical protein
VCEFDELTLEHHGAHNDRRFAITDDSGHLVNGKHLGALTQLVATCDTDAATLTIRFPDGDEVAASVALGESGIMVAYGHPREVRPVIGPWSLALSRWAGRELRVVQPVDPADGLDRSWEGSVTLLSCNSLRWLAEAAGVEEVDSRRFRMTVGVSGVDAFAEERWIGRDVRVGNATVRVVGNVGRCAVTTQDPDTGVADLRTLHLLARLRADVATSEPLPFGVCATISRPGVVRVGDKVTPLD